MSEKRYTINTDTLMELVQSAKAQIAVVMNAMNQSSTPVADQNHAEIEAFQRASLLIEDIRQLEVMLNMFSKIERRNYMDEVLRTIKKPSTD